MNDTAPPTPRRLSALLRKVAVRRWGVAAVLRAAVVFIPLVVMLPAVFGLTEYELITRVEQRIYDHRLRVFDASSVRDDRIVIVDVDEASLRQFGRWPWRRSVIARLGTELLQRQQVALLGFDILFSEPDEDDHEGIYKWLQDNLSVPDLDMRRRLQAIEALLKPDTLLAESLRGQPVVQGFYFSSNPNSGQTGVLPQPLAVLATEQVRIARLPQIEGYSANLPQLVEAAPAGGFMNALTDSDGELRSVPLVAQLKTQGTTAYYPSLSLAMFMAVFRQAEVRLLPAGGEGLNSGTLPHLAGLELRQGDTALRIPTNIHGAILVPFRSKGGHDGGRFRYVSAADVLNGKLGAAELQGRVALIGSTAPGLRDLRVTPVSTGFPGVEVHATLLSAMLDGTFIHVPDYARGFSFVMILLVSLVLLVTLPRMGAGGAWLLCLGLVALMTGVNLWAYVQAHVALPLAAGIILVMMTYVLHISYGFFLETRTKKQLASLFGHYVPAALVSEMVKRPGEYTTQAQSRELTIMFCDIHAFTRLAEHMDPQQVQVLLNRLFNRIAEVIAPNHGTIDKYIGDCVMVFWGAPLPVEEHAWLAVKTASDISSMLADFNAEQERAGQPVIHLGMGVNSGMVSVGDMGSRIRRSYTVLGDAVNLAARLEPLAQMYGVSVVVGERTMELAAQVQWQWIDCIRVAGRTHAINVYAPLNAVEPLAGLDARQRQEMALWQQFRDAYRHHAWDEGLRLLESLQALQPAKKLYAVYQERLRAFRQQPPPPDWSGVTDMAK